MTISIFWVAYIASVLCTETVCIPCVLIHAAQIILLLASGIDMVLVLDCICFLLNWCAELYFLWEFTQVSLPDLHISLKLMDIIKV
jgi:hypothetical protein